DAPASASLKKTESLLGTAVGIAIDNTRGLDVRLDAIRLLAHAPWESAGSSLVRLMTDDPAQEVRIAALRALAAQSNPEVAPRLLAAWKSATPAVRREISNAMLSQPDRVETLLAELEAGRIPLAEIDPLSVRQLENHSRAEIRQRARNLLRDS